MLKQEHVFKKLVALLLALTICFGAFPGYASAIEAGEQINVKLTGHIPEQIEDNAGNAISITNDVITVPVGTYSYNTAAGNAGSFIVDEATTEVQFAQVKWKSVWPAGNGTLTMSQGEREFTATGSNANTVFVVPACGGDSYYTWSFTPEDDNILPQTGHVYIYSDEEFAPLNLSDSGAIPYVYKNIVTVKAPKEMEVFLTSQLKYYMARDYQKCIPDSSDDNYNYYTMHAPTATSSSQVFMLRQNGKVTRYGYADQVGTWNDDSTVLTLRELANDPYQINRNQSYFDANVMTNLPTDSQIELSTGEYFDLVPLRAWQAIGSASGNNYQDPPYNYYVIGDSVEVTVTEDDEIGQYGRITAVKPGISLVLFSYEAMEWAATATETALVDENGLLLYSALWPELTGVAVVKVDGKESGISTNIDMTEGRTVYFLRSQTSETGIAESKEEYATYTFKPITSDGCVPSVRVHSPIMVENGALADGYTTTTDWLNDGKWTAYTADAEGHFTLQLAEGRNIVEIKNGENAEYHVITARGVDVILENVYNSGNPLAVGDTVRVTFKNLLPALYKQAAIYNPSANPLIYLANGVEINRNLGQYTVSTNATFTVALTEEDEGTFQLTNGGIATSYWGSSGQNYHRELTRCSMLSIWTGGDNPETNLGMLAILPDISFDVVSNEDLDEVVARNSSLLEGISISATGNDTAQIKLGETLGTEETPTLRNWATMVTKNNASKLPIKVGAKPLYDQSGTILVRTWVGTDSNAATVTEIPVSTITYTQNSYGNTLTNLSLNKVLDANTISATSGPANVEVISVPESGTPTTYAAWFVHQQAVAQANPVLKGLSIAAAPGSGVFGRFDGILEAQDVTYSDASGQNKTLDLGYGFILTEYNYTTQVPFETDKITYSATVQGKIFYAKVNGGETQYNAGESIPLNEGTNTLVVTAVSAQNKTTDYTITIERAASPDYVTFDVPAGAEVTVKKSGKTQEAFATNTNTGVFMYELPGGTYTYSVELEGYYTKTGTFTAPTEEKIVVKQEDMESLPGYTGSFQVSIHGQQDEVCALTAMAIPEEAEDLLAKKYVTYNYGGYTVLHALLDACENAGVSFKCSKGVLTPSTTVDNSLTASGAGWVCEVNGAVVEPFSTLVKSGDVIRFYYNNNSTGMTHAWFDGDTLTATRGSTVTVTLMGADVANSGSTASAISGATILVDGKAVGTTDYTGKATIATSDLLLGSHTITASKEVDGVNILTYAQANLTLNKAADADTDPSTTEVTFRLIGDNKHSTSSHEYTTWIATETYTFAASSVSVADVFDLALECAGLEHDDFSDNYVAWINAPESLGGYKLSEKDNGSNSGWQYTVNGVHPSYGVNDFEVTSGDEIIFHYVDDYTTEETKFTWLAAEDVNPDDIDPVIPDEPVEVNPSNPSEPDDPTDPDDPEDPTVPDSLNIPASLKDMYEKTAATLLSQTPKTGTTGGDWMLFGLARSTFADSISDSYKNTYLAAVREDLATMNASGQLDAATPTENMRVALALTALGYDATNFEGYNLIKALENTTWVTGQGNNASAFALLAMDACDYVSTNTSVRQTYIDSLIENQNPKEGGWAISGTDGTDQDTTMMVVTALAPYYKTNTDVKAAVDKALDYIKTKQTSDGGFGTTAEGNAQVIVALTALGIDPDSTDWNTNNGLSVIDALAEYYTGTGFMHDDALPKFNQMASEQSFYAMVAYIRYLNSQPSLYDMSSSDNWPAEPTYKITVNTAENGTVTTSVTSAEEGATVTVTAEPAENYTLDTLTWNGTKLTATKQSNGKYTATFTMPAKAVTVQATFKAADNAVADVADMMKALSITSTTIDQTEYEAMMAVQEAYNDLTTEQKAQLEDEYSSALAKYERELEDYEEGLENTLTKYQEKLEKAFDKFDEEDYSEENWEAIEDLYEDAKEALEEAIYKEAMEEVIAAFKEDAGEIETGADMEVTFRLIGDFKHEDTEDHVEYVTWIATTDYTLESGATVYDLFMEAISDAGLNQKGASSNYVSSIQAPDCLGGYWLSEFDNGKNSGWMYTVNGDHPSYGLTDWELKDGDEVIWHYVDDYKTEEDKNTWLKAKDIDPEDYVDDALEQILVVGDNGEVEPDEVKASDIGKDITFKFIPDDGYVVKEVKIDGESKGKITSYKYEDLRIDSRIEVEFVEADAAEFDDVKESDWFYDDVQFVVQNGLFNGTSDTTFSPNVAMNRAMLVTVLYRLEGEPDVSGSSDFDDVGRNQWYTDAVIWATENEIVNGYGNGKFGPTDNITREQMATILYRYAQYKDYSVKATNSLTGYSDYTQISAYALKSLKWANAEGLINGRTETTLAPQGTATRAEVAAILHRFVENVVNAD